MTIKNIFFDFDGVLAESVSAKTDAFRELYLPFGGDIAEKVVAHHKYHGGVSRYEKFRIYHSTFLGKELTDEEVQVLAGQFSDLVLKKVIASDEVPGAKQFLEKYYKKMSFWIITGTPTKEIAVIASDRSMDNYFLGLHGSPEKKKYWTEYLLNKNKLNREETLFLGDAVTDYEAAVHSKIHFALREDAENKAYFQDFNGIRFTDFYELEALIKPNLP
jgi:phosphoglycolate phosphatase-like HAD superfamily hydrolase